MTMLAKPAGAQDLPGVLNWSVTPRPTRLATSSPVLAQAAVKDSNLDGTLVGLLAGVATATAVVIVHCRNSSERSDCWKMGAVLVLPIGAGAGLLAGYTIDDRLIDGHRGAVCLNTPCGPDAERSGRSGRLGAAVLLRF